MFDCDVSFFIFHNEEESFTLYTPVVEQSKSSRAPDSARKFDRHDVRHAMMSA